MAKEFTHFKTSLIEAINNKDKIVQYNKRVLIIGYGGVGECMCHLLIKHVVQSPTQITIVEKENKTDRFEERNGDNGVKFVKREVVRGNLEQTLKRYTERGGLVVDCSLNIGAEDIVRWCMENGVLYTNTSLERWKDQPDETIPDLADRTLYHTASGNAEYGCRIYRCFHRCRDQWSQSWFGYPIYQKGFTSPGG